MDQFLPIPEPSFASALWATIGVGGMFSVTLVLGLIGRKRWSSFSEYMVGRRNIGPVATGCAVAAAYLSGWAFCGSAGISYSLGWSGMWFAGVWTLVGIMPCVWITALRTRELSMRFGATTLSEILGFRFNSKMVQTVVSLTVLFYLFMYSVGQLKAAGGTWYAVTGWHHGTCLLIAVVVTFLYMYLGGYTSTQWSLAFQGAFLGIVGLCLGIFGMIKVGGPTALNETLMSQDPGLIKLMRPELPKVGKAHLFSSAVGLLATPMIFFTMAIGFPHNVSRFLGMRELTKRDYAIMALFVFLVAGLPIMIDCAWNGTIARALYGGTLFDIKPWGADLASPYLAWGAGGLPLVTLYVAALFAAALSTLSAMIFIMAGNISRDLIKLWRPQTSDRFLINLTRLLLAVFLVFPLLWTWKNPPELLAIFMGFAAIGLGGTFFYVTAVSYYWKNASSLGVILAVIYGLIATLWGAWQVSHDQLGMGWMFWIVFIGCGILYFGGGIVGKKPDQKTLDTAFPPKAESAQA
jgi:sodium/proline symporter